MNSMMGICPPNLSNITYTHKQKLSWNKEHIELKSAQKIVVDKTLEPKKIEKTVGPFKLTTIELIHLTYPEPQWGYTIVGLS